MVGGGITPNVFGQLWWTVMGGPECTWCERWKSFLFFLLTDGCLDNNMVVFLISEFQIYANVEAPELT